MSRTLSANFAAHLAGNTHKRARLLRLDLADGTALGFTDHDESLSVDLGDGALAYAPSHGMLPSDVTLSTGFAADEMEISGPLGADVARADVLGGRFDDAVARFFMVRHDAVSDGALQILRGFVTQAAVHGGQYTLTVRSEIARFAQEVGRTITAYCDADFGDARCGYTPETLSATVTGVTDARTFAVSFSGTYANDYFNAGTVSFDTGDLAGTRPVEISDFIGGTGAGSLVLWTELAEAPEVGDTLTLTQGCGKTRDACLAFDNVENFRGFPDVPGTDQVLRYPNPSG